MAADVITWGRLRAPIGNGYSPAIGGAAFNNAEYPNPQFVSASDQSPLRTYYTRFFPFASLPGYPWFDYGFIDPTGVVGFGMQPNPYSLIPADAVSELIGETVTLTPIGDTFVMTAQAFDGSGQSYAPIPASPITAIGKLTIV